MKFRNLISAAVIALLPIATSAATLVVPAAGTGPGANGSRWQSEVTLHNAALRAATVTATFHYGTAVLGPVTIELQSGQTTSIQDIARTKFGLGAGTGAIVLQTDDRTARSLAITSRTFNTSAEGEFGQDIPSINVTEAVRAGDRAALPGPSSVAGNRFNFGVYAIDALTVTWEVVRANGTVGATKAATYAAGQHVQYGSGIETFLGVAAADNDTVRAHVTAGKALFYGSIINATGDPTFVPSTRTRNDILINFEGVDADENGTVDIEDANHDGVLDSTISIVTSLFPDYFRVVAAGEFGESVTYEIVSSPATKTDLIDDSGTLRIIAAGDLKNTDGEIVIRMTSGGSSSLVTIPVKFR